MAPMDVSVVIRLTDQLSGPAKQAAAALKSLVQAAQQLNKLSGAGGGLNSLPAQLNKMTSGMKNSQSALKQMVSQMKAVTAASKQMQTAMNPRGGGASAWANQQVAAIKKVQQAQQQAAAQATRASRTSGGALAAGAAGGGMISAMRSGAGRLFGLAGGVWGAAHATKYAFNKAGDQQQAELQMKMLGIDSESMKGVNQQIKTIMKAHPNYTRKDLLDRFMEIRYAMGDNEHAIASMGLMSDVDNAMAATNIPQGTRDSLREQGYAAAKAAEQSNKLDPKDFPQFMEAGFKTAMVSGGMVDWQKILSTYKYSRMAQPGMDDEMRYGWLPEIIQENATGGRGGGGGKGGAGPMLSNAYQFLNAQQANFKPAFMDSGLVDPTKAHLEKGKLKLDPGAVLGAELAGTNLPRWVQQYLRPALKKAGLDPDVKTPENLTAIGSRISSWGGTAQEAQLLTQLATQFPRMLKRLGFRDTVDSVEEANKKRKDTYPQAQSEAVGAFQQAVTDVATAALPQATASLKEFTSAMQAISGAASGKGSMIEALQKLLNIGPKIQPPTLNDLGPGGGLRAAGNAVANTLFPRDDKLKEWPTSNFTPAPSWIPSWLQRGGPTSESKGEDLTAGGTMPGLPKTPDISADTAVNASNISTDSIKQQIEAAVAAIKVSCTATADVKVNAGNIDTSAVESAVRGAAAKAGGAAGGGEKAPGKQGAADTGNKFASVEHHHHGDIVINSHHSPATMIAALQREQDRRTETALHEIG